MELRECIKTRRSIRKFENRDVPNEIIREMVDDARFSPSWKNSQINRYYVIKDRDVINRIVETSLMGLEHNSGIVSGAPVLVVMSYKKGRCGYERDGSFTTSKGDMWQMFDAGIAAQTFCLSAHDKGVGSVIMGIFDEEMVAKCLELPEDEIVSCLIAIGYGDEAPTAPKRKETEDILKLI